MKKGMIVLIALGVIVGGILLSYLSERQYSKEVMCIEDSDCVKIKTTCCPCSMGGEETCGSAKDAEFWRDKLAEECTSENIVCPAVYNCRIDSCVCVDGNCTAVVSGEDSRE